jgi:hypothetical protein
MGSEKHKTWFFQKVVTTVSSSIVSRENVLLGERGKSRFFPRND